MPLLHPWQRHSRARSTGTRKSKNRTVLILGPIGLSMDDGGSRVTYLKMRAMVIRELRKLVDDGIVTVIGIGLPWSGHIGLDAINKLKHQRLRLRLELATRFDEIHTPDRKMWDGRFSSDQDGARLNAAHFGFRSVTGIQSLRELYTATTRNKTQVHQSIASAFRNVMREVTTVIVFPTADFAIREIIDEMRERSKEIIEFKHPDVIKESIVPKSSRINILKRAVKALESDGTLVDAIPGDIFVEAVSIMEIAAARIKAKEMTPTSSPCLTSPPPSPF